MDELVAIITNAQRGDRDAFDTLVCRFQRMAIAAAYASVRDPHLAEDVAQEAFLPARSDLSALPSATNVNGSSGIGKRCPDLLGAEYRCRIRAELEVFAVPSGYPG